MDTLMLCENALEANALTKVRVQYFGSIRGAAQKAEDVKILPEDMTALRLLRLLADEYGEGFRGEVFAENPGLLRDDVTLAVNGAILRHEAAGETLLRQDDTLALFPVFPGGG